jgi:molybdate transport system permease protein
MIFPPMALGFFIVFLLGKNGLIGNWLWNCFHFKIIFSFWGLLIAAYVVGLPYMVKSIQTARRQIPQSLIEAAETMGKSKFLITMKIILPNIQQGLLSGLLLSLGRSLGEVGISLMLGGNIVGRTETISLSIYNAVFEGDFKTAAIFSGILSVIAILILLILERINRRILA